MQLVSLLIDLVNQFAKEDYEVWRTEMMIKLLHQERVTCNTSVNYDF